MQPSLIITTPLVYGAAHVAEALGVPLHVTSAVPWVPSKVWHGMYRHESSLRCAGHAIQ